MSAREDRTDQRILDAIDHSIDGIAVLTFDREIVYYNKGWVEMHGLDTGADYTGMKLGDIEREQLHPMIDDAWDILREKGIYINQLGTRRRDGKFQEIHIVAKVVPGGDTPLVLVVIREVGDLVETVTGQEQDYNYLMDLLDERGRQLQESNEMLRNEIDGRMRAEEILRLSESNYRTLVEQSLMGILITKDNPLRHDFANEAMAGILGYSVEELTSLSSNECAGIVFEEDRPNAMYLMRQGLVDGKPEQNFEMRIVRKDGSLRWLLINSSYIEYDGGPAVLLTCIDITEHKMADEALRRSEEKLKAQYKNIPVPTYTWQKVADDFVLVDFNEAAVEITKGRIGDYIGIKATELYGDRPEIEEELERCLAEKKPIEREELYRFVSTDESRHLAVKYAYVPPDLVLVHTEDVTDRRIAENELKQYRDSLEEIVRERTEELEAVNERLRREIEERQQTEGELEQRNRELAVLNKVNGIINSDEAPESSLAKILEIISEYYGAEYAILLEVLHEQKELVLIASQGLAPEITSMLSRMSLHIERVREMLSAQDNVFEVNLSRMRNPRHLALKDSLGVKRAVAVNCRLRGRSNFIAYLGSTDEGNLPQKTRRLLGMMAKQLGIALERLRLIDALERREEELKKLAAGLIDSIEDERRQIALSLHDEARQSLVALKVEIDMLKKYIPLDVEQCTQSLDNIEDQLKNITDSTRRISHSLHPSMLEDLGLVQALEWYADRFIQSDDLEVTIESLGFDEELPEQIALTLYRIAQEALTNIVKHAGATGVTVRLTKGYPRVIMVVEDDGRGFSAKDDAVKQGLGIVGMRERVELIGGSFRLKTTPGQGVHIRVTIPLEVDHDGRL